MPTGVRSRLPAQVLQFLEEFAVSGNREAAAESVGVHPRVAERFAREVFDHPGARDAFDQIMRQRFAQAGPIAMNLLLEIATDPQVSARVRVEAAKTLLDRSGFSAKALSAPAAPKDLHELTREELLRVVEQGEGELAARAKQIGNRTIDDAIDTQVIDLTEE